MSNDTYRSATRGDTALPTTVEIFVEHRPGGVGQPSEVDAFADLYNRTFNPLVAYCRRYCPPGYDPEDIAQEALSRAWSSWDRYSPSRPFWPWVATIARRLCVDYWRRDERAIARAGGAAALEPCVQPRPDELSEAADECRMAVTAFRRLRPDHQRIVGLRDIEGWSYEDIARFEGVTVESIRGSLRRARMSLRKSYESLAKGGVPALAPLGAFIRAFQRARARMAVRMARWQTALHDTGVASTRLGEALVSLMALSVGAVSMGGPGGVVHSDAGRGLAAVNGQAAAAVPPVASSASGAGASVAGSGAAASAAAAPVVPPWSKGSPWKAQTLLPGTTSTDPGDAIFESFTTSPHYEEDHTVFAVGAPRSGCATTCGVLFKSTNGGADWHSSKSVSMNATKIVLPPAWPADNRIFATGSLGLQVSTDGGETFITLLATTGTATMSPAFSAGDPRLLLPDAPGWQYNATSNLPEPLGWKPGPNSASLRFSFAFPTGYDVAHPLMYVGAAVPQATGGSVSTVYRCQGTSCDTGVALAGMAGEPQMTVTHTGGRDVLWATDSSVMYRSLDGGVTYTRVALPPAVVGVMEPTAGPDGQYYVLGLRQERLLNQIWRTADLGASWQEISTAALPTGYLGTVKPLPDGTILVGLNGEIMGVACSHDQGRTWRPAC
ncbi:MAG: hypothetical protein QOK43_1786 [Acidimicrobiaceae bacterium]|nr:hypothetical protein [Acidimicrobiaceae bacterium]